MNSPPFFASSKGLVLVVVGSCYEEGGGGCVFDVAGVGRYVGGSGGGIEG